MNKYEKSLNIFNGSLALINTSRNNSQVYNCHLSCHCFLPRNKFRIDTEIIRLSISVFMAKSNQNLWSYMYKISNNIKGTFTRSFNKSSKHTFWASNLKPLLHKNIVVYLLCSSRIKRFYFG